LRRYGGTRDTYQQQHQQEKSELKEYARAKETPVLPFPFPLPNRDLIGKYIRDRFRQKETGII